MNNYNDDNDQTLDQTWMDGLDDASRQLVELDARVICIQAGPGTGKSYCTTRRLLRLLQQRKVSAEQVLAVTFTRTAANDLRNDLTQIIGEDHAGFTSSTLHALCYQIVEGAGFLEVRDRHPRFLLTASKSANLGFEAAPMLADLRRIESAFGNDTVQSGRIREFEAMWARHEREPLGVASDLTDQAYEAALLAWLKFHKCMLVGELVPEAYKYLSSEPTTPWRTKFKAILVDEYQDLNKVDQATIDLLTSNPESSSSIVGDIDQSIFSFRHAHPTGMRNYKDRDGVTALTIPKSRRCPTAHLDAAQALIRQNTVHADEYPTALDDARAGHIYLRRWETRLAEIEGIVSFINYCLSEGVSAGEILVMVPSRIIGKDIKVALREREIEARSYFDEEHLEEAEAQKAFTLLTLLNNKHDRVALRSWLGGWSDSQDVAAYAALRTSCEQGSVEPFDYLADVIDGKRGLDRKGKLLERFSELTQRIEHCGKLQGQTLLDELFPAGTPWADSLHELAGEILHDKTTISELYELLLREITQPSIPSNVQHVRIMSFHKAKGLTATASVIAGAVQGLCPRNFDAKKSPRMSQQEFVEEQRRLFYVAMTRSRDYLLISSSATVDNAFAQQYRILVKYRGNRCLTTVSDFVTSLIGRLPASSDSMTFGDEE